MSNETTTTTSAPAETTEAERMHALALRTAERIEKQAAAVLLLEQHEGETPADILEADPEGMDAIVDARDALELETIDASEYETGDVADGIESWKDDTRDYGALSIARHGTNHGEGWVTDSVVVVLGTGGPHVQVEYEGNHATVRAFGWFKEGETTVPVDAEAVDLLYGVDCLYRDEE